MCPVRIARSKVANLIHDEAVCHAIWTRPVRPLKTTGARQGTASLLATTVNGLRRGFGEAMIGMVSRG